MDHGLNLDLVAKHAGQEKRKDAENATLALHVSALQKISKIVSLKAVKVYMLKLTPHDRGSMSALTISNDIFGFVSSLLLFEAEILVVSKICK